MYVGRFLVVGPEGGAYRVSSRSFPNRRIVDRSGDGGTADTLTVGPTTDAPETDNPYVSYNCLRIVEGNGDGHPATAVFGNGSHVDPIAEKRSLGYPARDTLVSSLLALDYEKDDYDTPRIAATVSTNDQAYVGIVRRDALLVERVEEPTLVATYECDEPGSTQLPTHDAETAARAAYDAAFEHAVCAAGVSPDPEAVDGFETAIVNGN